METKINKELMNELVTFRKMLHANPEVSGKEYNTAKSVAEFLKNLWANQNHRKHWRNGHCGRI